MEWNKQTVKNLLLVVCGGAAFYVAIQHLNVVFQALGWLLGILYHTTKNYGVAMLALGFSSIFFNCSL